MMQNIKVLVSVVQANKKMALLALSIDVAIGLVIGIATYAFLCFGVN